MSSECGIRCGITRAEDYGCLGQLRLVEGLTRAEPFLKADRQRPNGVIRLLPIEMKRALEQVLVPSMILGVWPSADAHSRKHRRPAKKIDSQSEPQATVLECYQLRLG
jgi:hypothetical protein